MDEQTRIQSIFERLEKQNPSPETELSYVNPYTLLVAVILSAQSTDKGVNKATESLFQKVQTPQGMLELGEEGLQEYIKTIGLFRNKAKNIIAASQMLVEKFNGKVPGTREELEILPGVGRKTANVVLHVVFKEATMPVDTHVYRVSHRLHLSQGTHPEDVEEELLAKIPENFLYNAHHWLILHGRYTCKAKSPSCETCVLYDLCPSRIEKKGDV